MQTNKSNNIHVFTVRFEVPETELREYGESWGNRFDVATWPKSPIAQFATILQSDLYDYCGMSGQFQVTEHTTIESKESN